MAVKEDALAVGTTRGVWTIQRKSRALSSSSSHPLSIYQKIAPPPHHHPAPSSFPWRYKLCSFAKTVLAIHQSLHNHQFNSDNAIAAAVNHISGDEKIERVGFGLILLW